VYQYWFYAFNNFEILSKIVRIETAVPAYKHDQHQIAEFMKRVYQVEGRSFEKLGLVYEKSMIDCRYSIIPDFSLPEEEWQYFSNSTDMEPFPKLNERMKWFMQSAPGLAADAVKPIFENGITPTDVTHLITVSCTGMSAPGIDVELVKLLGLRKNCQRSSINFMGCYAALHGLKMADAICKADPNAVVIVVCVELCTIHFQKDPTSDNIASTLLFSDGAAAVLVVPDKSPLPGFVMESFYAELAVEGEEDMSWCLSETGFLMHLSNYIPRLIESKIDELLPHALEYSGQKRHEITRWAIHPGGKKILEASAKALAISNEDLCPSFEVLRQYGNMSSPTILFVLKKIMEDKKPKTGSVFAAAFGPGITIETMLMNGQPC
jgi:alkylresorcinol/alkylpyrone synthase